MINSVKSVSLELVILLLLFIIIVLFKIVLLIFLISSIILIKYCSVLCILLFTRDKILLILKPLFLYNFIYSTILYNSSKSFNNNFPDLLILDKFTLNSFIFIFILLLIL